jgi:hypothetical protein
LFNAKKLLLSAAIAGTAARVMTAIMPTTFIVTSQKVIVLMVHTPAGLQ